MFIAPLRMLLALVGNRPALNRIAHWTIRRRALSKVVLGAMTVLLGFAILITA